jgi:hypothetical protein
MADPVTRRNLEAAIGRELQAKGLSQAGLLVSYFADVYRRPTRIGPSRGRRVGRTSNGRERASPQAISRWPGAARHGRETRT